MPTTETRRTTCRYLRRSGNLCTAEVVDEHGEVLLCAKHLARAMEMIETRRRLFVAQRKAGR